MSEPEPLRDEPPRDEPPRDEPPHDDDRSWQVSESTYSERAYREWAAEEVKTTVPWWKKELRASPLVVGLGVAGGSVGVIFVVLYFTMPTTARPPETQYANTAPIFAPFPAPAPLVLEPGQDCAISNLRQGHTPFGGGHPSLQFDYRFPRERRGFAAVWVGVVVAPSGEQFTSNLHLHDESGTVSLTTLNLNGAFPLGTTVYLGDPINGNGQEPKRVSNILTLK